MSQLSETDFKSNLKQAFNATDKESIVRVVDYADFLNRKNLDRLSIMTYLYQIREKYDPTNLCSINISPKSKTLASLNKETRDKNILNSTTTPCSTEKKKSLANKRGSLINNQKIKSSFFNPFDSEDDELDKDKIKEKQKGIIEINSDNSKTNLQKKPTPEKKVLIK